MKIKVLVMAVVELVVVAWFWIAELGELYWTCPWDQTQKTCFQRQVAVEIFTIQLTPHFT